MQGSMTLARIGGIEIRAHYSWLVILALVTLSLATVYFPTLYPRFSTLTNWVLGFVAAILLFVAVLLHELSHSFVARARGLGVHSITLFIFGGVSSLVGEPKRPVVEFLVAAAGPASSLLLAGLFYLGALAVGDASREVTAVLQYLAIVNLVLGLFNLVPGFPLDGGRVLRSIVWQVTGSFQRATAVAAGVGQLVGYGFIFWGIWQALSGNVLGGIWIALIGWFLSSAAEASTRQVTVENQLAGVKVRDVMRRNPVAAQVPISIQRVVDDYLLGQNLRALPLIEQGRLVGMVTLSDISRVPREEWENISAETVMSPFERLVTVGPDDELTSALERMAERDLDRLPVVVDQHLYGILSRSDLIRYLQIISTVRSDTGERAPTRSS